jgi:hypothetical protein
MLRAHQPWAIPFIVLLVGEYVVEIIEDIYDALPTFDRASYANFVQENRPVMRLIRARTVSYWDRFYRREYSNRRSYPGLIVLRELEEWASSFNIRGS